MGNKTYRTHRLHISDIVEKLIPWRECSVMDEKLKFIARLIDGETMTEVCREFGISRKTGISCGIGTTN